MIHPYAQANTHTFTHTDTHTHNNTTIWGLSETFTWCFCMLTKDVKFHPNSISVLTFPSYFVGEIFHLQKCHKDIIQSLHVLCTCVSCSYFACLRYICQNYKIGFVTLLSTKFYNYSNFTIFFH